MIRPCAIVLLSTSLLSAPAVGSENGTDAVLKEAADTYKRAKTYRGHSEMVVEISIHGMENKVTVPFDLAVKKPGMIRVESDNPLLGVSLVSDGKNIWNYRKGANEYTKKDAPELQDLAKDEGGPLGMMKSPILLSTIVSGDPLAEIEEDVTSKRLVGTETVDGVECDVIEMAQTDSTARVWVDRKRKLIVKLVLEVGGGEKGADGPGSLTITETHKEIVLDGKVPDGEFTFSPPEGAKLVDSFTRKKRARKNKERADLTGTPAPDFILTDMEGKKHRLEDLRGKVVLLDFWASWCPPCRRELPHIQKIHEEMGPQGLVVLGVNAENDEAKLKEFLQGQKIGFPVLRDTERKASEAFSVTAIPRVLIIGKDGTVAADFTGLKTEEELKEALVKAGAGGGEKKTE